MLPTQPLASDPSAPMPNLRGDAFPRATQRTPQRLDSRRLLDGRNEAVIEHAGQEYRLRLTRNDKLILTK